MTGVFDARPADDLSLFGPIEIRGIDFDSGEQVDLTTKTVQFAFVGSGVVPTTDDAHDGIWGTRLTTDGPDRAAILVGPVDQDASALELAVGVYAVYWRVVDDTEHPFRKLSKLLAIQ